MAWITEDGEGHEGWAPAVWPDGAVSVGWTAGQVLVRPVGPDGRTAHPEQTRDGAGAIGWRGMCACGWQGPLHRAAAAPDRRADPPEETEEQIRADWLAHIGQARNLEQIRTEAWAVSAAQARLTDAVRAARAAGHSWTEIGQAAGITRQAAHERWAHLTGTESI